MASRFHQTNSNELEALKSKTRNKNTDHSTGTWINTFQSWAKERGLNQELSWHVPHDLNDVLMKFYAELRKADGSEYEPACLRVMRASLDRYLKEKKYPVSLLDMEEFKESNLILPFSDCHPTVKTYIRELRRNVFVIILFCLRYTIYFVFSFTYYLLHLILLFNS